MTLLSSRTPPKTVAWLGYGGLLPFIGLALASALDREHGAWWTQALLGYGAVILSFVGALHWGVAMVAADRESRSGWFAWSVVPSLLGWAGLLVAQAGFSGVAAMVLVTGFLAHFAMDLRLAKSANLLPDWYLPLRLRLTAVATLCLLLALALRMQP